MALIGAKTEPPWLVVWNMIFIFPYIGNVIIPTDELICFRWIETTNQTTIWAQNWQKGVAAIPMRCFCDHHSCDWLNPYSLVKHMLRHMQPGCVDHSCLFVCADCKLTRPVHPVHWWRVHDLFGEFHVDCWLNYIYLFGFVWRFQGKPGFYRWLIIIFSIK